MVLTPFVLRELGVARYGVWILTSSIIGYYGFLDLGFRAGVTQYLTRYLALGDYDKSSDCMSSAVAALSVLGLLLVALSIGAAYIAPQVFRFSIRCGTRGLLVHPDRRIHQRRRMRVFPIPGDVHGQAAL